MQEKKEGQKPMKGIKFACFFCKKKEHMKKDYPKFNKLLKKKR